jgi:hypothetical protein
MSKPISIGQSHALVQAMVNNIHWNMLDGAQVQKIIEDPTSLETTAFILNGCKLAVGTVVTKLTLAQMIADAGFKPERVNGSIVEQHFPLDKEGIYDASGLRLFGGDREWAINEVESAVKPGGGRLEGLVRGLAYLKANHDALKAAGPILFPASPWVRADGNVDVPCAVLDDGEPRLLLSWDDRVRRWTRHHRFLVSGK